MEEVEQQAIKLSKINSAALINLRINNLWMKINNYAVSGKYFAWNNELDRIWCELGGDVKKNSDTTKEFHRLDKIVSEKLTKLNTKEGFTRYSQDDKETMSEIYNSLMKKEEFLRALMNKQGKGTAYDDDDDFE